MNNNNSPQILITPFKPALIAGMAQKISVLVRVQAPDAAPERQHSRKPYHLALVIDRSGSMDGEPLSEAVRCASHIIDRLAPTDRASLVVFDNDVDVLSPARPVGDRKALHALLARIHSGGTTNLHGGWKAGAESLLEGAHDAAMARVILLSDGNANAGETIDPEAIAACCANAAAKGVTTSTYGLGYSFNEELMVDMARSGAGNSYYGETAADLFEPFAEEFDFISSLYARHLRLSVSAPNGVTMRLLNDYAVEEREGFPLIRLPDVPYGAEAWALLELEVPAAFTTDSAITLLQAGVSGSSPDGVPVAFPDASLSLAQVSPAAWDALIPDPLVVARQAELEAGKLLQRAREAAKRGDWTAIREMIDAARKLFADHPWVMDVLENIAELAKSRDVARLSKEAMYSSRKMSSRVSAKDEALMSMVAEGTVPSFLRRKRAQGKAQFTPPPDAPKE